MKITFLGTGTSVGVPMIGCGCAVCTSADARNRRRRSSLYIQAGGMHLVVDTPPDFREQALTFRVPRVDAVFFTHGHADHVFGFDDIRRYNTIQDAVVPAYGSEATIRDLRRIFHYAGADPVPGLYRPLVEFRVLADRVRLGGVTVRALPVAHGCGTATAYCFEADGRRAGYAPDCSAMPESTLRALRGVDVMILDALRHRPHPAHLTVADSLAWLQRIGAARSFLTHMAHDLDHAATQAALPDGVTVPCDGLAVEV
jgi:phosphoribosyl 1,2-cyclic phosphate phosphodiesterase